MSDFDFELTDEQQAKVDDLKAANPKSKLYALEVEDAPLGFVVFEKPGKHNRDKYTICKKQLNEGNQVELLEMLARTFLVWPTGQAQKDLFDDCPALAMRVGGQIQTLAAGFTAEQAKKV